MHIQRIYKFERVNKTMGKSVVSGMEVCIISVEIVT
jgi:hypothetical protein